MIKGTFEGLSGFVEVIVDGNNLMFFDVSSGQITTIEGLRILYNDVINTFPDLENNDNWKKEAINKIKEHMKTYETEMEKLNYVKDELVKFGNKPLYYQKAGWRRTQKWE